MEKVYGLMQQNNHCLHNHKLLKLKKFTVYVNAVCKSKHRKSKNN